MDTSPGAENKDAQKKDSIGLSVGQAALSNKEPSPATVTTLSQPTATASLATPPVDVSANIYQSFTPYVPAKSAWRQRLLKSYAYLPEYLVMLLVLTSLLYALTSLLNIGIDSLIHAEKDSGSGGLASYYDLSSFELVTSLAALAVSLPAFIWLYIRTKATEAITPAVKTHRWRKAFLGTFIAVQLLTIIGNFTVLAYQLISRLVDESNALTLLSGSEEADPWWQLTLASLLTAALLGFVVYILGKEYRSRENA